MYENNSIVYNISKLYTILLFSDTTSFHKLYPKTWRNTFNSDFLRMFILNR